MGSVKGCSHVQSLMADVLLVNQAGMEQSVIRFVPMVSLVKTALRHVHSAKMDTRVITLMGPVNIAILAG